VIDDWKKEAGRFPVNEQFIESGAMKIFADGALGGRTALLSHPYADDQSTNGVLIHSLEELTNLVGKARKYDLPVAVHAIGDLAFEYVLRAIEKFPVPAGKRDRLIHAQILRKDLIERAKHLSLILDIPWVIERIGKEKMKYHYAWKTLLEEGLHCAGGSDAPIEPADPLLGIHAAVTRTNPNDPDRKVYGEKQRLTVYEAVSLFTKGSAYAICHEHDRGLIKPGYTADFTVLDKDLFKISEHEILSVNVRITVVNEEKVYEKQHGEKSSQ
jgi:predicted amidohydrolase YtcJ